MPRAFSLENDITTIETAVTRKERLSSDRGVLVCSVFLKNFTMEHQYGNSKEKKHLTRQFEINHCLTVNCVERSLVKRLFNKSRKFFSIYDYCNLWAWVIFVVVWYAQSTDLCNIGLYHLKLHFGLILDLHLEIPQARHNNRRRKIPSVVCTMKEVISEHFCT